MRFLIISRPQFPIPPEQFPPLMDAFAAWRERYRSVTESFDFFAGGTGGCGIVNVADAAALNQMMIEYPFATNSNQEVYALLDGDTGIAQFRAMLAAMMPKPPGG